MNNVQSTQIPETSPRSQIRFVVTYYLITLTAGAFVLTFHGRSAFVADLLIAILYLSVTALLYGISKPLTRGLR